MTIIITDKSTNFKEYTGFISKVSGLIFALMHGNGSVDSALRLSGLTSNSVIKGSLVNASRSELVSSGGLKLISGSSSPASYLQIPLAINDYGNKGFTVFLAIKTSAKIQLFNFAGFRFAVNTDGSMNITNQSDGTVAVNLKINLIDLGYSASTLGVKTALISVTLNINSPGFDITTNIHDSNGLILQTGTNSFATASLTYGAYPYIGGTPAGPVGTIDRNALHYGSFYFNRPLNVDERASAAKQLAQYANYLGAEIV